MRMVCGLRYRWKADDMMRPKTRQKAKAENDI